MRRPATDDNDDDDEKDKVTIKSMIISMVRVCISFFFINKNILLKKIIIDASSFMEINDMSSHWLDWLFCYSFVFY